MLSKPKPSTLTQTVRPFEAAYIEHVPIDLEIADPFDGSNLGRLWLTIMTDPYKWRVLAYYPTFEPPGFFSHMQVVNECASRHGRLPRTIVTNDGLQFRSKQLERLFAACNITLILRPPARVFVRSRWERLFRETETQLIAMLRREAQPLNVKRVPMAIYPKPADCDIMRFDNCLKDYVYAVRDVAHPSESEQESSRPYDPSEDLAPRLSPQAVRDISFLSSTLPIEPHGMTKIIPGQGVTINHFKYWSPVFRNLSVGERQVDVRYDPFDLGIALAFVEDRWEECRVLGRACFDKTMTDSLSAFSV